MAEVEAAHAQREANRARAAQFADQTPAIEEVRRALSFIPAQCGYDIWLRLNAAVWSIYPGGDGIALIEGWSAGYAGEVEAKFEAGFDGSITLGTLFHIAKEHGYQPLRHSGTAQNYRETSAGSAITRDQILAGLHAAKKSKAKPNKKPLAERISPYELPPFTADQVVDLPYISDLDPALLEGRDLALRSPMGTGKTELTDRVKAAFEAQHGRKPRLLMLGHREALGRNQAARLGIECYKDIDDHHLPQAYSLASTIHSSGKLAQKGQDLPCFDIVVIDETTQVFRALSDQETWKQAGKKQVETYEIDKRLIAAAGQVIALDANLDDTAVNWIASLRGGRTPYRIENSYRQPKAPFKLYASSAAVLESAADYLRQGKRIALAFGSKQALKAAQQYFKTIIDPSLIQAVHGDISMTREVQDFISTINTAAQNIQCLLYTSTLGSGIDITAPFDAVFGVFGRNLTAEEICQMIGRVRHTSEVHCYISTKNDGTAETDAAALTARERQAAAATEAAINYTEHGTKPAALELSAWLDRYRADDNRQRNHLLSAAVAYLQKEGYTISYVEAEAPQTDALLKDITRVQADEIKAAVLSAEPVDFLDYDHHRHNGTITDAIRHGHLRWRIEECLGQVITAAIYDDLHNPGDRAKLRFLTSLRTEARHALDRDKADIDHDVLPMHRKHASERRRLTLSLIKAVFEVDSPDDLPFLKSRSTEDEIARRAGKWIAANMRPIQLYIDGRNDLSRDPLAVVRRVLAKAQIKLDYCQQRIEGERVYTYSVDKQELARWLSYSDSRIAHLEQKVAVSNHVDIQQDKPRDLRQQSPQGRFVRLSAEIAATWDSLTRAERLKMAGMG